MTDRMQFDEGRRETNWLSRDVVKYHRTMTTNLGLLIRTGFTIDHVEEFCPDARQIADMPTLAEELERPMFLLVAASR